MSWDSVVDLWDYRRRVAEIYYHLREQGSENIEVWRGYRREREELLSSHPQSALDDFQKLEFEALPYFEYDPSLRFIARIDIEVEGDIFTLPLQDDGDFDMKRIGRVKFDVGGSTAELAVYWIKGYGGGIFLPFRDMTNQTGQTYGGGRYLLDSIKGADLGKSGEGIVLDFNYAYNPSCAYNSRWHCPLAPQENWLTVPVMAGEMVYQKPK